MKRKNRHADRLSALPDEMLASILSHLASDEAVRTSALSRRWRDVYEAVPVVDLVDHKKGRRVGSLEKPPICFDQKVTGAILCKAPGTPIRTFCLDAFFPPRDLLDQWIASAMSFGAEEINVKLRYWHDSHNLCTFGSSWSQEAWRNFNGKRNKYVKTHHRLFGCPTLRRLRLTSWTLDLPQDLVASSLETLCLARIMDPNRLLQQVLSNCPRLVDLTLQECPSLEKITVTSTHLRKFAMICCHHAQRVDLHSPYLKSLLYKGGLHSKSLFNLANYAGVMALKIEICEDLSGKEPAKVAPITTLISRCTELSYLHLSLHPSMAYNSLFIDAVRCLSCLRQLGLQGCLRNEDDVRSVAVFLCDTPSLEVLSLFPLGPQAPKKRQYSYFSDSGSDDEQLQDSDSESDDEQLQDNGVDYCGQVIDSYWPMHIRCLDDKLRRIKIGKYKGLQLQKILAKFLLSRTVSLEEFSVTLTAGCSRRKHARELRSWQSNSQTMIAVTRYQ